MLTMLMVLCYTVCKCVGTDKLTCHRGVITIRFLWSQGCAADAPLPRINSPVPLSKGVYFIGEKPVDEELVFDEYVDDGKGMFGGYQLFNDVGISNYIDCKTEIYTNNIKSKQKNVGQYFLKKVDLEFDDDIVDLIALLEIIDTGYSMKGCDFMAYKNTVDMLLKSYSDSSFEKIVKAIHYKYSTIKQLSELLEANSIDNNCVDIFEAHIKI